MRLKYFFSVAAVAAILFFALYLFTGDEGEPKTIGFISLTAVDQKTFAGFKKTMAEYGYVENRNIRYLNDGPAGAIERLDAMITSQIKQGVDLFFVSSTPATLAVQHATMHRQTPVVFCPVNDPVASGIVASLEYPAGNLTGVRLPSGERQRFEWFLKLIPEIKTVLIPFTPGDKSSEFSRLEAFYAAQAHEIAIIEAPVQNAAALRELLARPNTGIDAIYLPRDSTIEAHINDLVAYADRYGLPLSVPSLQQVEAGALFAYGFIHADMGRQAAAMADRILKGASPASLPVETAKNHLIINRDTARKLGLEIPADILEGATQVPHVR